MVSFLCLLDCEDVLFVPCVVSQLDRLGMILYHFLLPLGSSTSVQARRGVKVGMYFVFWAVV